MMDGEGKYLTPNFLAHFEKMESEFSNLTELPTITLFRP